MMFSAFHPSLYTPRFRGEEQGWLGSLFLHQRPRLAFVRGRQLEVGECGRSSGVHFRVDGYVAAAIVI